ncbi:MAG: NAD+ synthase [Leptolyngbyaceae cyanobacterium SM1_3_5]|nr:NAD+ synthase [Leptolyngbyaceae cyanobacterium SM1_3_5]
MKIAIAQLNPTIGNLTANAEQILDAGKSAHAQGAELLLTTELSLCGYPPRDLLMQPSFISAMNLELEKLARSLPPNLAVLVGTVTPNNRSIELGGKPLFNSTALLQHGKIQQIFHKRLLPTYDVFDEDRYFEPSLESSEFKLNGVKIGVTICEDLWNDDEFWGKRNYPANPIADLAHQGVDLVVNLSASPYSQGKQKLREAMLQHAARRYELPILYANQVGGNDDLIFDGNSVGFDRTGTLVCRSKAFTSDLTVVEFDRDLLTGSIAPRSEDPDAEIWSALTLGVQDYARKCGFSKVVIGLSGGIDSALVAAIATTALGRENVLGVLMPSPYSSDHSISDALKLAENLGIETQTLAIAPMMQAFDQTLENLFENTEFGLAEENLQSRIRGTLLMSISNKFGHLLLSTGNKSEMAVGYCTLYGDMNGGLAAIADVPKTRVYSLCRWLNRTMETPPIPENVLIKPPSAELKPGQVDQDSLPPYDVLDDILDRFLHLHQSPDAIAQSGHDADTVNWVIKLVTRSEFKRKQAPPGLKITDRAFGTGWRMPIACRWLAKTGDSEAVSPALANVMTTNIKAPT